MNILKKCYYGDIPDDNSGAAALTPPPTGGALEGASWPLWEVFIRSKQGLDHKHVGRFTYTDTRYFFITARGSVTETMEHLATACDEEYILPEELKTGEDKCELVFKLINGYINYLDKSKSQNTKRNEPNS